MLVPVCSQTFIVYFTSSVLYQSQVVSVSVVLVCSDASKLLRSTMGQERLTGLALMHVNYGMELNLDEIISIFASRGGWT